MLFHLLSLIYIYVLSRAFDHICMEKARYKFLRNGPDKNDSNNGNEHVGMQKKVLTFLLSVLTFDWLKQQKLTKLHKAVHIFILTFQNLVSV